MSYEIEGIEVDNDEANEAIEVEVDLYDEDEIEQKYREGFGTVVLGGIEYDEATVFEDYDPIAYSEGLSDSKDHLQETETKYNCPDCGIQHDDEDDAKWCCQDEYIEKFEVDGETFDSLSEAEDRVQELEDEEDDD